MYVCTLNVLVEFGFRCLRVCNKDEWLKEMHDIDVNTRLAEDHETIDPIPYQNFVLAHVMFL